MRAVQLGPVPSGPRVALLPPLLLLLLLAAAGSAQAQAVDLDALCSYTWEAVDSKNNAVYKINVCGNVGISSCGPTSAICMCDLKTENCRSVGDSLLRSSARSLLEFNTTMGCQPSDSQHRIQTSITFLCGKTLGTPEFVTATDCVHYFEWRTTAACKKDIFKADKEVPCYAFDDKLQKHDLNPLIKLNGGYLVDDSDPDTSLFINVCRDIDSLRDPSTQLRVCPAGTAACLLKGNQAFDVGRPKEGLKLLSKDRLVLTYVKEEGEKPDFCNGHSPAVTVTFVCPSERRENQNRIGKQWMAARQNQKSISSSTSVTGCCRRERPGTVLKMLLCALWIRMGVKTLENLSLLLQKRKDTYSSLTLMVMTVAVIRKYQLTSHLCANQVI